MKIAVFSDLQGFDNDSWKLLMEQGIPKEVALIITLGDIDVFDLKRLKDKFSDISWIGIHGNHDFKGDLEYLDIRNLHLNIFQYKGVSFGGFEGSLRYKKNNALMYTQEEVSKFMEQMPPVDVFLSHNSPFGIHDKKDNAHQGFTAFKDYVDKSKPKFLLHGHQHINKETVIGETKVVGIYGGYILDTNTGNRKNILTMDGEG